MPDEIPELEEAPTPQVRARMRRTRQRDTSVEIRVRRLLHRRGLRYRVDRRPISAVRSRADIVFVGPRVAVYIDSCFWHGCPQHGTQPKKNSAYWSAKLNANKERDARVKTQLEEAGWCVLRIWGHVEPEAAADQIEEAVRGRRPAS